MKINYLLLLMSFLAVSCSLHLSEKSGLAQFQLKLKSADNSSDFLSDEFEKVKNYPLVCLYTELEGGGESWGSELQEMAISETELSAQFKVPSLWVGRTYKLIIYGFKEKQGSDFRCPQVTDSKIDWARLGYTKYEVPSKPEPLEIPFVDFYESNPDGGSGPTISLISPARAKPGTTITIQGTGFQNGETVELGGVACPLISQSPDELSCTVPSLGSVEQWVPIKITNPDHSEVTLEEGLFYDAVGPTIENKALDLSGSTLVATFDLSEDAKLRLYANDSTCSMNPVSIEVDSQAGSISLTSVALSPGNYLIFLKAVDLVGQENCIEVGIQLVPTVSCAYEPCGSSGNSCYEDSVAKNTGFACLEDGTQIDYVYANGSSGFKVWKEHDGDRILKATGLWSSSADWQKKLTRSGKAADSTDFTDFSQIAGRACPTHVYLGPADMTAINECLYYDTGNVAQKLDQDNSGTWGEDYLTETLPAGISSSWYQGNIKTCADKGMRLPTLYETLEQSISGGVPSDANPSFGGTRVPAVPGSATWTATAYLNLGNPNGFWRWLGSNYYVPDTSKTWPVRCVLQGEAPTPSRK